MCTFADAIKVYSGMIGLNGVKLSHAFKDALFIQWGDFRASYVLVRAGIVVLLLVIWLAPNTAQILGNERPHWLRTTWALVVGVLSVFVLALPERVTEFIYFQF